MINKEIFETLSKEQLIYIIEHSQHSMFLIGETCLSANKSEISLEDAIRKIRDNIYYLPTAIHEEDLKAWLDLDMGKITPKEYRKIVLGD